MTKVTIPVEGESGPNIHLSINGEDRSQRVGVPFEADAGLRALLQQSHWSNEYYDRHPSWIIEGAIADFDFANNAYWYSEVVEVSEVLTQNTAWGTFIPARDIVPGQGLTTGVITSGNSNNVAYPVIEGAGLWDELNTLQAFTVLFEYVFDRGDGYAFVNSQVQALPSYSCYTTSYVETSGVNVGTTSMVNVYDPTLQIAASGEAGKFATVYDLAALTAICSINGQTGKSDLVGTGSFATANSLGLGMFATKTGSYNPKTTVSRIAILNAVDQTALNILTGE